jgi:hypothetical protein
MFTVTYSQNVGGANLGSQNIILKHETTMQATSYPGSLLYASRGCHAGSHIVETRLKRS